MDTEKVLRITVREAVDIAHNRMRNTVLRKARYDMKYENGKDIFPERLLKQIQKYVSGKLVYIPSPEEKKKDWGEASTEFIFPRLRAGGGHEVADSQGAFRA